MKILLTGATGLLGSEIKRQAEAQNITVLSPSHAEFNLTDRGSIERYVKEHSFEVVINCAAQVNVDVCEKNPDLCFALNRDGVRILLEALKEKKKPVVFVQISSSEVFGRVHEGEYKTEGYTEDEAPQPVSVYQKSKAEAEKITKEFCEKTSDVFMKYFIVRAGWLYGKGRPTFVEQFAKQISDGGDISAIKDQWRSPTWTKYFALQLLELLSGNYQSGFYHSTSEVGSGEVTTIQAIQAIAEILGKKADTFSITPVSRQDIFKVPRAPSNVLKNTKLPKLPHWKEMLREYLTR